MPAKKDMPSTVRRSPASARRTWSEAHDSAVDSYGEGERAHRTAFSALKRGHEKVGDHWEPKPRKGPSDERAKKSGPPARRGEGTTAGGVDANASKHHLYEIARRLDISGRSTMDKGQLVEAIQRANARRTRNSRS